MPNGHTIAIVIAIIGLIVIIGLNTFFIYVPVRRIEDKIDKTADDIENALSKLESIEKLVADALDDIKDSLCSVLPALPICQNN